jgi:hypothetical protein
MAGSWPAHEAPTGVASCGLGTERTGPFGLASDARSGALAPEPGRHRTCGQDSRIRCEGALGRERPYATGANPVAGLASLRFAVYGRIEKGGAEMLLRRVLLLMASLGAASFFANFGGGGGP